MLEAMKAKPLLRGVRAGLCAALLLFAAGAASAAQVVNVYLFWAVGCPHCERATAYLKRLEAADPRVRVHYLEVSGDARARRAMVALAERLRMEEIAVPLILVGEQAMVGYGTDAVHGEELKRRVDACLANACADAVAPVLAGADAAPAPVAPQALAPAAPRALPKTIVLPLLGEVALENLSLPVLTVVLGALDGFNPCAMWVLVFLIGLLLGMQDRTRMWVLGAAFIAGSAAVYFLFMAAWLNFLLFVGGVVWVRAAIGLVALGGGFYYLRQYFRNAGAVCEVTAPQARRRVFENLRRLATESRFWLALLGIVALAFAVNLVELLCSAGIPAIYTQVLALSHLPAWQYYAYLMLYILVFMLDDLFVFVLAMRTLQISGLTDRYSHYSHLGGGILLLVIGALLLLRPDLLMFG